MLEKADVITENCMQKKCTTEMNIPGDREQIGKNIHFSRVKNAVGNRRISVSYLYSSQLLIAMSSMLMVQNALMNALARRALVISGIFRSMAARRIL